MNKADITIVKSYIKYVSGSLMGKAMKSIDAKIRGCVTAMAFAYMMTVATTIYSAAVLERTHYEYLTSIMQRLPSVLQPFSDISVVVMLTTVIMLITFLFKNSLNALKARSQNPISYILFLGSLIVLNGIFRLAGIHGIVCEVVLVSFVSLQLFFSIKNRGLVTLIEHMKEVMDNSEISDKDVERFLDGYKFDNGFVSFGINIKDPNLYSKETVVDDIRNYLQTHGIM